MYLYSASIEYPIPSIHSYVILYNANTHKILELYIMMDIITLSEHK